MQKLQITWKKIKNKIKDLSLSVQLLNVTISITFLVYIKKIMKINLHIRQEKQFKMLKILHYQLILNYSDVLHIIAENVMVQKKLYLQQKQVNALSVLKHIMKNRNACHL